MTALIGADRQRMNKVFQRLIRAGRQRLLQHRHAKIGQQLAARRQTLATPRFVSIHDQGRLRHRVANSNQPLANQMIVELDLQQPRAFLPQRGGAGRHLFRRADYHGLRRHYFARQIDAKQLRQRFPCAARLQIPQRTVDGVARGSCRQ